MSNQNNNSNAGNNSTGGNSNNSFAEIMLIGHLATVKDPNSDGRVHAFSKPMNNNSKVANATIAINNKDKAEFWNLEVWASSSDRSGTHDFLMDHCYKGRQVFVTGTPMLNVDANGKAWPTIRVNVLRGLGDSGAANQQSGGQQQNNQQQPPAQQAFNNQNTTYNQNQNGFGGNPNQQPGFNQGQGQPPMGQPPAGQYQPPVNPGQQNYPPATGQQNYPPNTGQQNTPPAGYTHPNGQPPFNQGNGQPGGGQFNGGQPGGFNPSQPPLGQPPQGGNYGPPM